MRPSVHPNFAQACEEKEPIMLSLLAIAVAWAGRRAARAGIHLLRAVPRRNEDLTFY